MSYDVESFTFAFADARAAVIKSRLVPKRLLYVVHRHEPFCKMTVSIAHTLTPGTKAYNFILDVPKKKRQLPKSATSEMATGCS